MNFSLKGYRQRPSDAVCESLSDPPELVQRDSIHGYRIVTDIKDFIYDWAEKRAASNPAAAKPDAAPAPSPLIELLGVSVNDDKEGRRIVVKNLLKNQMIKCKAELIAIIPQPDEPIVLPINLRATHRDPLEPNEIAPGREGKFDVLVDQGKNGELKLKIVGHSEDWRVLSRNQKYKLKVLVSPLPPDDCITDERWFSITPQSDASTLFEIEPRDVSAVT